MHENQATAVAKKIVDNLAIPLHIENQEISIRVSIGIALFPGDGNNAETLLKNADAAMYRTKVLALEKIQFYTDEIGAQALDRLKMEQQLYFTRSRLRILKIAEIWGSRVFLSDL
jgi:GGDEF domain-containing protein